VRKPTWQEMFDRAWTGLDAQGWEPSTNGKLDTEMVCVYLSPDGKRCAYGHVDPEGTGGLEPDSLLTVDVLRERSIGIAAMLNREDVEFAVRLQGCHDEAAIGVQGREDMKQNMLKLAREFGLTVPGAA
jgi:hypothetical protein